MAYSEEELFDILNEDGTRTGRTKARGLVHRDGDLHGASHVFVIRRNAGRLQVLMQKRSADKDSFPSCWDTSAAGHLDTGENFDKAAVRELKEELGVSGPVLKYIFTQKVEYTENFYDKPFHDNEIDHVYIAEIDEPEDYFRPESGEVECVQWQDADRVLAALRADDPAYCVRREEFEQLVELLNTNRIRTEYA